MTDDPTRTNPHRKRRARRRRALVAAFNQADSARRAAAGAGQRRAPTGIQGTLVDIGQSPFDVPRAFANDISSGRQARADAALAALGDTELIWEAQRRESAGIGTVLSRLGADRSARLLHHAYVLAAVNLSVVLGFDLPSPLPGIERFSALVREG